MVHEGRLKMCPARNFSCIMAACKAVEAAVINAHIFAAGESRRL